MIAKIVFITDFVKITERSRSLISVFLEQNSRHPHVLEAVGKSEKMALQRNNGDKLSKKGNMFFSSGLLKTTFGA